MLVRREARDQAKVSHFFQILSPFATDVVIGDENIFWLDGRETRNVLSLYIGNLFSKTVWCVGVE